MGREFKTKNDAIRGDYSNELQSFCDYNLYNYTDETYRINTFSKRYENDTIHATSLDAEKTANIINRLATKANKLFFQEEPDLVELYVTLIGLSRACGRGADIEDYIAEGLTDFIENSVNA